MHRFFIPKESFSRDNISITGQPAHKITLVLRLKPRDHIIVLDNSGFEFEIEIESVKRYIVMGRVIKKEKGKGEPAASLTLCQALLKTDKFEFVLQKGVELGVSYFVPFISKRCIIRKPSENRTERWQNIIREAAEQSRRSRLPILHPVITLEEASKQIDKPALILWEGEKKQSLVATLKSRTFRNAQTISIFIGPEGGFESSEIDLAQKHGIIPVGLGRRILRAETAALAVISAVMYEKGELG